MHLKLYFACRLVWFCNKHSIVLCIRDKQIVRVPFVVASYCSQDDIVYSTSPHLLLNLQCPCLRDGCRLISWQHDLLRPPAISRTSCDTTLLISRQLDNNCKWPGGADNCEVSGEGQHVFIATSASMCPK